MMNLTEDKTFRQFRFFINGHEVKFSDLEYEAPAQNRVRGFEIQVQTQRMGMHLGNVEFIKLMHDDYVVAMGWVIVEKLHMHYWKFSEVVSYSPWWSGIEKWAESIQGE